MVIRKIAMAAILATVCAVALAAPTYQLDRKSIALGEEVTLTLSARPGILDSLDLTALAGSFEIRNRTLGGGATGETLTLLLYPLKAGRVSVAIPGLTGRPLSLEVTAGSKDTPHVHLAVAIEPATLHARQTVRLALEACASGALQWTRPTLPTRDGLLVRALDEQQGPARRDGEDCTAQRWHWALTATAAGTTMLRLPMLEANQLGRALRFPTPMLSFQVQAVPAWLPAEAAVGKPAVRSAPLPAEWSIERPLAWRIEVAGGYSTEALRNLLSLQLASRPELTAYPPTVETIATDTAVPRHALTLYLLSQSHGVVKLPDLVFPWYDPATGRLEQLRLPGNSIGVIDPLRQRLAMALIGFAILLVVAAAGRLGHRALAWRWRRRRAIAGFSQATDVADLARRLRAFSLRTGVAPAPTLGEWRRRLENEATGHGMEPLLAALDRASYGVMAPDIAALKAQASDFMMTLQLRPRRVRKRAPYEKSPA